MVPGSFSLLKCLTFSQCSSAQLQVYAVNATLHTGHMDLAGGELVGECKIQRWAKKPLVLDNGIRGYGTQYEGYAHRFWPLSAPRSEGICATLPAAPRYRPIGAAIGAVYMTILWVIPLSCQQVFRYLKFLSSCHARARAPRWMKMVSGLPASRVESSRQGWRQGRPNVGAVSLMSHGT